MEWWQWTTWGVALVSGIGGLVLGIRAELRGTRYRPRWTPEGGNRSMTFRNRTDEDAMNVRLNVSEGWFLNNYRPYGAVAVDEIATFATVPRDPHAPATFACLLRWTRASTGREYRLVTGDPELARKLMRDNPPPRRSLLKKLRGDFDV